MAKKPASSKRQKQTKSARRKAKPAAKVAKKKPASGGGRKSKPRAATRSKTAAKRTAKRAAKARTAAKKTSRKAAARPGAAIAEIKPNNNVPEQAGREGSGLSRDDIERFRQMLLEKRAQLMRDMATMSDEALKRNRQESSGNLSSMPIHMADLGTDNYEQEFTLGLIESERVLLHEIDDALRRIANGNYGVCAATGKPIGKARLNAQPWTKHCYEYVLAQESSIRRRF